METSTRSTEASQDLVLLVFLVRIRRRIVRNDRIGLCVESSSEWKVVQSQCQSVSRSQNYSRLWYFSPTPLYERQRPSSQQTLDGESVDGVKRNTATRQSTRHCCCLQIARSEPLRAAQSGAADVGTVNNTLYNTC